MWNEKYQEIFMEFLKLSMTKFLTHKSHISTCPRISVCTRSAVPTGENVDLGHTATGQSHDCEIDPQIRPAPQILPTPEIDLWAETGNVCYDLE